MISRRRFLTGFITVWAPLGAAADAQEHKAGKTARIGRLSPSFADADVPLLGAFRKGLRDLGWLEGQHFTIETRCKALGLTVPQSLLLRADQVIE